MRLADAPANIPRNWQLCNKAREYVASVVGPGQQEEKLKSRKLLERADGTVADGTCLLGELTDVGRQVRLGNPFIAFLIYCSPLTTMGPTYASYMSISGLVNRLPLHMLNPTAD